MGKQADEVMSKFTPDVEAKQIDTSRKLKIGIIGTGWIAESHILSYKKMPDVEIVAAADLIPGKAEAFMKRFGVEGVRFYPSHKELIDNEELDGVSVCTYNAQHKEPTIYALEHGVNVLLEKPFTVTLDEAVEKKGEGAKIAIRNIRRDGNDAFKKLKKEDVSEDEIKDLQDDLQKQTDKFIKDVDKSIAEKSKEILTV